MEKRSASIKAIENRLVDPYAPPHFLIEFFQVARKKASSLSDPRRFVKSHYDWVMRLPIQYVEVDYVAEARDLRRLVNAGVGSYDAIYIHLAQQRSLPLCTCDRVIVGLRGRIPRLMVLDLDRTPFSQQTSSVL